MRAFARVDDLAYPRRRCVRHADNLKPAHHLLHCTRIEGPWNESASPENGAEMPQTQARDASISRCFWNLPACAAVNGHPQPKERPMKTLVSTLLAAGLLTAGTAYALADTIVIQPAQQKVIHEYVVKQNPAPVVMPSDTTVEVGTVVPESVQIQELDVPDMPTRYDYMVVNGQTVLVDPQTRKIVEVLQ
jgi:hypothetical protein